MINLDFAETDWLGSRPVFYNTKTCRISYCINDVIDYNNIKIDEEGLYNYLVFGFCVWGHTFIENVRFLKPNSLIKREVVDGHNRLVTEAHESSIDHLIGTTVSKVGDVYDLFDSVCEDLYQSFTYKKNIVLPLSGGFDSRWIAASLSEKKNIKAFTYGLSWNQCISNEVIYAKEVAAKEDFEWEQIKLDSFEQYESIWFDEFGPSTHLHGMYQIEFYKKIKKIIGNDAVVFSGLMGDAWAGKVNIDMPQNENELNKIGFTHGNSLNKNAILFKPSMDISHEYYENNKHKFTNKKWLILEAMRTKIILLSYLLKVPEYEGFVSVSPFLNESLVIAMMNLPDDERSGRKWQMDYFKKKGLDLENNTKKKVDIHNSLDLQVLGRNDLKPLNPELLSRYIDKEYVTWINKTLRKKPWPYMTWYHHSVGSLINPIKVKHNDPILEAYTARQILMPLQIVLEFG